MTGRQPKARYTTEEEFDWSSDEVDLNESAKFNKKRTAQNIYFKKQLSR